MMENVENGTASPWPPTDPRAGRGSCALVRIHLLVPVVPELLAQTPRLPEMRSLRISPNPSQPTFLVVSLSSKCIPCVFDSTITSVYGGFCWDLAWEKSYQIPGGLKVIMYVHATFLDFLSSLDPLFLSINHMPAQLSSENLPCFFREPSKNCLSLPWNFLWH